MFATRRVPYYSVMIILSVHILMNSSHSSASSHWVVTEEGKIQAQVLSIWNLFIVLQKCLKLSTGDFAESFGKLTIEIFFPVMCNCTCADADFAPKMFGYFILVNDRFIFNLIIYFSTFGGCLTPSSQTIGSLLTPSPPPGNRSCPEKVTSHSSFLINSKALS